MLLAISICSHCLACAQTAVPVNMREIATLTGNPASNYFYPKLLKRYNEQDTTLTPDEYRLLYYGFALQPEYMRTDANEDQLLDALKGDEYADIAMGAQMILRNDPFCLRALDVEGFARYKLDSSDKKWMRFRDQYSALGKAIISSGDGLTQETAFKVISLADQYIIMKQFLDIDKISAGTLSGTYNRFTIESSIYFKAKVIYFDISLPLTKNSRLTDEGR